MKTVRNLNLQKLMSLAALAAGLNLFLLMGATESNTAIRALSSVNAPAVAWSAGAMRINGTDYSGSGNVLPGGRVEMLRSSGQLYLADGTRMRLSAATRMTVEKQSVSLESGIARVDAIPSPNRPLQIAAGQLSVKASGGVITRNQPQELIVTAADTATEVRKANGVLVAMVRPGETRAFYMQSGGASTSSATSLTGKVSEESGHYYLTDEATQVKTELQGGKPSGYVGQTVQVCGELIDSRTADQRIMKVQDYSPVKDGTQKGAQSGSCPASKAAAIAAGGAAAGGAAAGAAAGTAAGTVAAAGGILGVSTAVVTGVVVTTVAVVATSVALVTTADNGAISQQ